MFGIDLNQAGRAILRHMDYRICGLVALALCAFLTVLRRVRFGTKTTIFEFFTGVLAIASIYGGVLIAVTFLLTKPPAIEYLSGGDLMLTAIVTLVGTMYLGWSQLKAGFFPPRPPTDKELQSDEVQKPASP
jgi:hypothetical protein